MLIYVAGLPVMLYYDANGFIIYASFQTVTIDGSPLIVHFTPPIAGESYVSFPETVDIILKNALVAAILTASGIHIGS